MPQSTFGIRRATSTRGSADLRTRLHPDSVPTTDPVPRSVAVSHGPRTSLIDAEWGSNDSQPDVQHDSVPVESEVRRRRLDTVSYGPRTSLIDAQWGSDDSQPDVQRESKVRQRPSKAVIHRQPTARSDSAPTKASNQSDVPRDSVQVKSKIGPSVSKALSQEPRTVPIESERAMADSQLRVPCEVVPVELSLTRSCSEVVFCVARSNVQIENQAVSTPRRLSQDGAHGQLSPRMAAPRRNTVKFLWLASSIIVLSGLGFGLSRIGANGVTGWVTNPVPPSVPVVVPRPPAPISPSIPVAATGSASENIPVRVETFSEPLVLSPKASLQTVNRRPAVPRKAQTVARTSRQLPSVVRFDDL